MKFTDQQKQKIIETIKLVQDKSKSDEEKSKAIDWIIQNYGIEALITEVAFNEAQEQTSYTLLKSIENSKNPEKLISNIYKLIDKDLRGKSKLTPIQAIKKGDLDAFNSAISAGASINAQTTGNKKSLLMYALELNRVDIINAIINHKEFNPNVADASGNTAAMFAKSYGLTDALNMITKHPSYDKKITNDAGRDVSDITADQPKPTPAQPQKQDDISELTFDSTELDKFEGTVVGDYDASGLQDVISSPWDVKGSINKILENLVGRG